MRKLIIIMAFGFFSCGQESKTIPTALPIQFGGAKSTSTSTPEINPPDGDPAFVLTKDTISTHGPGNITRNVLEDRNGMIWFATWEGIISYDGKLFTNVTLKEGLRHFHIFSLLEDATGNLWFGTIGGGVYRYDGKSFTLFTTRDGLGGNVILCMMDDKAGNIWFATGNGVSRCRYDGKIFTNYTTQDGLVNNSVSPIAMDKTGKLWFGTRGGISYYDGKSFSKFTNKEGISLSNITSIVADKNGNIWIGSGYGLYRYDGKSLADVTKDFPGNVIFEDKTGNLWLIKSKDNGMDLYQYDGKSFTKIIRKNGSQNPFYNQVFGVTEDRDRNIWFGTANGVCRYDGKSITDFSENVSKQ